MFAQKSKLFVIPTIVGAIVLAILSFIVVQTVSSYTSSVNIGQVASTVHTETSVTAKDVGETADFLKVNQQSSGLAHNWEIYQASLNYADYPTMTLTNYEMANFLKVNQQSSGLAHNWEIYQASLNYADYRFLPPFPPQGETGNGPY